MRGGTPGEIERLDSQAALTFEKELFLLRALGIDSASRIAEIGSGSGAVTERLVRAFPGVSLFAVDPDSALLAAARLRPGLAAKIDSAVSLVEGTCESIPLSDNSMDVAIVRYVFQHLLNPVVGATEIMRILRPGGRIVVIDSDAQLWGACSPYTPELMEIHARAADSQESRGGDRYVARALTRILQTAGYVGASLHSFAVSSDEVGLEPFAAIMNPENLLPHVESGLITMSEYALVLKDYQRFVADPTHVVMSLGFLATATTPGLPATPTVTARMA